MNNTNKVDKFSKLNFPVAQLCFSSSVTRLGIQYIYQNTIFSYEAQKRLECWISYSLSCVWLFVTPWTVACQALLSMEFSKQEYWKGLPLPTPGDLPNLGIKPVSPALASWLYHWATIIQIMLIRFCCFHLSQKTDSEVEICVRAINWWALLEETSVRVERLKIGKRGELSHDSAESSADSLEMRWLFRVVLNHIGHLSWLPGMWAIPREQVSILGEAAFLYKG